MKTCCLYLKTPQIKPENEGFISPTATFHNQTTVTDTAHAATKHVYTAQHSSNRRFHITNSPPWKQKYRKPSIYMQHHIMKPSQPHMFLPFPHYIFAENKLEIT